MKSSELLPVSEKSMKTGNNNLATQPLYREGDVVLRDGSTVHVRPIRRDDDGRLLAFFQSLSAQSRRRRFFSTTSETSLAEEARRETEVDDASKFGIVATIGQEERFVGHALYARLSEDRAEVAFAIADDAQGQGLGTILLGQLAEVAAPPLPGSFTDGRSRGPMYDVLRFPN